MADVQPGGRLIQQHNRRFLGQHRNPRPLPLAAESVSTLCCARSLIPVARIALFTASSSSLRQRRKQRLVRIAPAGHQLLHRDIARGGGILRTSSPMRRATSLLAYCWICAPSSQTWPLAGVIRRLRVRNSVDLPQPLGPIMAVK